MKRGVFIFVGVFALALMAVLPLFAQATGVTAEAIKFANLRGIPDIVGEVVGEIQSGTVYPVIGRNEYEVSTWYLLGDAAGQPLGWVYFEVVNVTGDIFTVPFSTAVVIPGATPAAPQETAESVPTEATPPANGTSEIVITPATLAPTPVPPNAVIGTAQGEVNIRYGPGADFARLGVAQAGDQFEIVGYSTQFPWVRIRYPGAPNDVGWISQDLLVIEGDVLSTTAIIDTDFSRLPTLTPTVAVLEGSSVEAAGEAVPLSPEFQALGGQLQAMVLEAGFDPNTSKFGALYLRDLQTGEALAFGTDFAFSGTSINKIAIMLELFGVLNQPPDLGLAGTIGNTMICSDNAETNRLLDVIGNGDALTGAEQTTAFLRDLGLERTFITAPYFVPIPNTTPTALPRAVEYPQTGIDQTKANPDLTNQMTVDEMGYLLTNLYQCGYQESGALLENFSEAYTPQECRKMLHVMSSNVYDAMIKTGAPEAVPVAHKHGYIDETHGNAAVVFSPGGAYVLVVMLYQPTWLNYQESFPLIAELARTVYNYYNPDAPLEQIREGFLPETASCNYQGSELARELESPAFLEFLPEDTAPVTAQDATAVTVTTGAPVEAEATVTPAASLTSTPLPTATQIPGTLAPGF